MEENQFIGNMKEKEIIREIEEAIEIYGKRIKSLEEILKKLK